MFCYIWQINKFSVLTYLNAQKDYHMPELTTRLRIKHVNAHVYSIYNSIENLEVNNCAISF